MDSDHPEPYLLQARGRHERPDEEPLPHKSAEFRGRASLDSASSRAAADAVGLHPAPAPASIISAPTATAATAAAAAATPATPVAPAEGYPYCHHPPPPNATRDNTQHGPLEPQPPHPSRQPPFPTLFLPLPRAPRVREAEVAGDGPLPPLPLDVQRFLLNVQWV